MHIYKCDLCGNTVPCGDLLSLDADLMVSDGVWDIRDYCRGCKADFDEARTRIDRDLREERKKRIREALIEMAQSDKGALSKK